MPSAALVPRVNDLLGTVSVAPTGPHRARRLRCPVQRRGPVELIGPYLVACGLLVAAGVAKAVRPTTPPGPWPRRSRSRCGRMRRLVRVGAVAEAALGAAALVRPRPVAGRPGGAVLRRLRRVRGLARSRGGAIASCGCFGTPDTPATWSTWSSTPAWPVGRRRGRRLVAPSGTLVAVLSHQPVARACRWWSCSALCAWLVFLAVSVLAALQAARRLVGVTHRGTPTSDERDPGRAGVRLPRVEAVPAQLHQPLRLCRQCRGHRVRPRPGAQAGHRLRAVCTCGNSNCGCGSTCCAGFTEFCCSVNGGYNYCPTDTVMGGWWKADNSSLLRRAPLLHGLQRHLRMHDRVRGRVGLLRPGCDGVNCGCGPDGCDSCVTGCFQFRYGQCNQHIDCIGRIVCRVVACVPPWEIDPTCTTTNAQDNGTAEQNAACWTTAPSPPRAPASVRLGR